MKKVISLLLAVVMLCSTFAGLQLTASAAVPKSGKCGKNVTYTFNATSGLLTISGSGNMYNYNIINNTSPFDSQASIKSVVIKSGVTGIGEGVFSHCSALGSVSLPNTIKTIGYAAFSDCKALTSIALPDSVEELKSFAFSACTKLTRFVVPASVTKIGDGVLSSCKKITSIEVDAGNTVYDSRNNCNAVIETQTNKLVTGCQNTVIPDSVKTIGKYAFSGCDSLKRAVLPQSVINIEEYAFNGCTELDAVTLPDSVVTIGEHAFEGCESITEIAISNCVKKIGAGAFCYCPDLAKIVVEASNPVYNSNNDCNAIIETQTGKLVAGCQNTVIPNTVKTIGADAFGGCLLKAILTIPASVTVIEDGAFAHCDDLEKVVFSNTISSIGEEAFSNCERLSDVYYSGSAAQWKKVDIDIFNEELEFARMHYYYNAKNIAVFKCASRTVAAEKLLWNKVAGAAGYQVQISNAAGNKWVKTCDVKTTNYVFKNLAAGNNYKFRIRFYKKDAEGKVTYSAWSKTLNSPTLPKGTALTKLSAGKKAFTAQWKKVAYTGYQVQYSTNSKFTAAKKVTIRNPKTLKTTIKNLGAKKTYYVRVRTYKTISGTHYMSAWSKPYKVKTK